MKKNAQEDSILMMAHPKNPKFRLALVADGVGGRDNGDIASYIAVALTMDWFKKIPESFFNSENIEVKRKDGKKVRINFADAIKQHLVNINENIIKIAGDKPGTTFSMAITRNKNDKDMVTSVSTGDSRILKISPNGKVKQLSKDDNLFEEGLKAGSLYTIDSDPNRVYTSQLQYSSEDVIYRRRDKTKGIHILNDSDIRFYNKNNVITGFLGCGQASDTLQKELDQNTENFITEDYLNSGDKLFLCSDGISDNFSNSEIANLMYTSRNSRECLKNMINAIYEIENKKQLEKTNNPPEYIKRNRNFKDVLKGAEDNISAIIMAQNQNSKEKDNESER